MRYCDSHILQNYTTYSDASARPGFDVANYQQIYPIAHGILTIPNTTIAMTAFVFHNDDLHSNLFGVAPLTNQGLSATYTNDDLQITTPTPNGPQTILYGLKEPGDNVWRFSLPKARPSAAYNVIRHEQHAELAYTPRPHSDPQLTKPFITPWLKDGSPTTHPSQLKYYAAINHIAQPRPSDTSPRPVPASGLQNH